MKKLELYQMENLQGGKWYHCLLAVGGVLGAAASASTFVGVGLAVISMAGAISSAHQCIEGINRD